MTSDPQGIALSVNLNKIALIRNSRDGGYPSVVEFGALALKAGAHGLTVHPRPDQRHIRPHDVQDLAELIKHHNNTQQASANKIELNANSNFLFNISGPPI